MKLTFVPHIKYIKEKCMKTMNILKVLSRTSWGSDRKCLMSLYKSLIRTRLDYGAIVYQSATSTALKMLDSVYHPGMCLSTYGGFLYKPREKPLRGRRMVATYTKIVPVFYVFLEDHCKHQPSHISWCK